MRQRFLTPLSLGLALSLGCGEPSAPNAPAGKGGAAAALSLGDETACLARNNNTVEKLLECVTAEEVLAHLAALQAIADANGGIRTSGTPGYDRSVDYLADQLRAAGYLVTLQPFDFSSFFNLSPSVLDQVTPAPSGPLPHEILTWSGSGEVTAPVSVTAPATGCEASDFVGFPAGNIALIQRGLCTFAAKATNAYNAGASGVVIYDNRAGSLNWTLTTAFDLDIAVVGVSEDVGLALVATPGVVLHLFTNTSRGTHTTANLFAETREGDPDNVVMVGAHLDSDDGGPGINDNGSGSAALLETALRMARVQPVNQVRFAWWANREVGPFGSLTYVTGLSQGELDRIALYLNFDVVGSPNYVFLVHDGDGSDGADPTPGGSDAIEALLGRYYADRGLLSNPADLVVASDAYFFATRGIPVGAIHTGSDGIKTAQEAAAFGGVAGEAYDPCYHLACDTYANVSVQALDVNADLVAFATLSYAMNTELVNGVRGRRSFVGAPSSGERREAGAAER